MKKSLLLLCALSWAAFASAQVCVRDSSLLNDTIFISPRPYTLANPVYGLAIACINQPYAQSVTIKVPPTFTFQGIPIVITNANLATTGAVTGLPTGISYVCDPPNCIFNANTLGCILLTGTPTTASQAPDTVDLKIKANIVGTVFGTTQTIPVDFPGPIAPGNYYLVLQTAAGCTSGTNDLGSQFMAIKNNPNPFGAQTVISVASLVSGRFNFEVFNTFGQRVYAEPINLIEGANQFTFEANDLPNGAYFYSISNAQGKVTRRMAIAK